MARNSLVAYSKRAARRASFWLRPRPSFLIIGGIRCGTTSLIRYLGEHPDVAPSATKEVHYYDWYFDRGESWYRSWFPIGPQSTGAGESSPAYLMDPNAPARVAASLPDVRLLLLLRNPIERAHSHYRYRKGKGQEKAATFEDALDDEPRRLQAATTAHRPQAAGALDCYYHHGNYAVGLERWIQHLGRDQLLIMESDQFYADPAGTYGRVLDFLGLPPYELSHHPVHNAAADAPINPETRAALAERYAAPNQALYDIAGTDWGWH